MARERAKLDRRVARIGAAAAAAAGVGVLVCGPAASGAGFYPPGLPVEAPHASVPFAHNTLRHVAPALRPTQTHLTPRAASVIANAPPSPNFLDACAPTGFDNAHTCARAALAAIDTARATEGLGPLPIALGPFLRLSPAEQIFVLTDLERLSRGLPPFVALLPSADAVAAGAAAAGADPTLPRSRPTLGGAPVVQWGANWAGGTANALGANYYWMYDDGPGGDNIACTQADRSACFGHRENILTRFSAGACGGAGPATLVMGAAVTEEGNPSTVSLADIEAEACAPNLSTASFTWTTAKQLLGIRG